MTKPAARQCLRVSRFFAKEQKSTRPSYTVAVGIYRARRTGVSNHTEIQPMSTSYVRAQIRHVEEVIQSDGPDDFFTGPDHDVYEVLVEHGPAAAFLDWFQQEDPYDLCRIGDTAQFIDLGSAKSPHDGAVIDFTFDEFFPRWLEAVADVAKAHLARMASTAIDALHDDP